MTVNPPPQPTTPTNRTTSRRRTSSFKRLMSIHWWTAKLYFVLFLGGWFMVNFGDDLSYRGLMYDFHKSLGVLSMMILTWRIFTLLQVWWRKYSKRWPKTNAAWFKKFALHALLYGFMWVVPITGFFLSNSYKANNVDFFGLTLPDLFPQNEALVELARSFHFWFAYTFLVFVILHSIDQWKVINAWIRRTQDNIRKIAVR